MTEIHAPEGEFNAAVLAASLIGEHVAVQCTTEDAIEGMSAFLNKRKPRWAL